MGGIQIFMLLVRFNLGIKRKSVVPSCHIMMVSLFAFVSLATSAFFTNVSYAETRTLKMYFTHTRENITVTFKRNGKYDQGGLKKLNRFLRDWRRKEPTRMDPALFDLVWEVYQRSGSRKPIHVISGYRSPRTNNMLRRRGRGVARSSQHTKGKALDFFLPDVSVDKLRELGLKAHRGGVGYYRGSFVHLDTGRVRHWPRMSHKQLARVFPKGRTIHVPSNGKRLKGYNVALANLKKGLLADGSTRKTVVQKSLIARIFQPTGDGGDETETVASTKVAAAVPDKPVAKPTLAAASRTEVKTATTRKNTGPDPFALELAAAKSAENQTSQDELQVSDVLASLSASQLAIPKRRPQTPADVQAVALAKQDLSQPEPTLSAPTETKPQLNEETVLASIRRPSVEVPNAGSSARVQQNDVDQLNSRIRSSLNRQKELTVAAANREQQANIQLASALATIPAPKPVFRALDTQSSDQNIKAASRTGSKLATPILDSVAIANSQRAKELADKTLASLTTERLTVPARREPAIAGASRVASPNPRPTSATPNARTGNEYASVNMIGELELGDLEGRLVKMWAVAASTRIGPLAQLTAPRYSEGTRRLAPAAVFSAGFASKRAPLRADRFTGRSLTRVAFASLRSLN